MRVFETMRISKGLKRWKTLAVLATAAALSPFTSHAAVSPPSSDDHTASYAQSAYIRFTEVAVGTTIQSQYKSLGVLFSGGTAQAHGQSRWLEETSKSLTLSLRDPYSTAALSTQVLSFDIDSAKGGGQFEVKGFNSEGA